MLIYQYPRLYSKLEVPSVIIRVKHRTKKIILCHKYNMWRERCRERGVNYLVVHLEQFCIILTIHVFAYSVSSVFI